MKQNLFTISFFLLLIHLSSCKKTSIEVNPDEINNSISLDSYPTSIATDWQDLHLQLIKTTSGYVPPVAARSLAYANIALYESTVYGTSNKSLLGEIELITNLPKPDNNKLYNWGIAANESQYEILKKLFESTSEENKAKIETLYKNKLDSLKMEANEDIVNRSKAFGHEISIAVFDASKKDNGHEAYKDVFPAYTSIKIVGAWKPVGNQKAMLPNWGKNTSLVKVNSTTDPTPPIVFSYNSNSEFFKEAKEVYTISKNLTLEQKAIANFFADGGGTITPPGHHMNVATIVLKQQASTLSKAIETYAKMGLALNDAFVACWRCKYQYSLLRPITYINETLDPNWKPLLSTPPFPEYTSGHSSGAGAASEILKAQFGENINFIDNTYEGKYPNRNYSNFTSYANESSNSRIYGGIHYRKGCEEGVNNGRAIASNVLNLKFK